MLEIIEVILCQSSPQVCIIFAFFLVLFSLPCGVLDLKILWHFIISKNTNPCSTQMHLQIQTHTHIYTQVEEVLEVLIKFPRHVYLVKTLCLQVSEIDMHFLNIKENLIIRQECLKKPQRQGCYWASGRTGSWNYKALGNQSKIQLAVVSHHCFFLCKLTLLPWPHGGKQDFS